jgi:hypothetical protein
MQLNYDKGRLAVVDAVLTLSASSSAEMKHWELKLQFIE